jgi:hypothetical protein
MYTATAAYGALRTLTPSDLRESPCCQNRHAARVAGAWRRSLASRIAGIAAVKGWGAGLGACLQQNGFTPSGVHRFRSAVHYSARSPAGESVGPVPCLCCDTFSH